MAKHRTLLSLGVLLFAAISVHAGRADSLGPISEETPPATCNPGSFITAIRCTGRYCDNMAISCASMRGAALGRANWTPWVSEEQGRRECPQNHYIAGLACNGRYCDNVSLYCVELTNTAQVNCSDTSEVSEESGGQLSFVSDVAGQRVFARSVKCAGGYCDRKSFNICEVNLR